MQNETINLKQHLAAIKEYWQPEIINRHGFQFRLVKLLGDYGWHTHGYSDKVLFAVEGEMAVVPKSVSHRPRSENGCSVVLIDLPDPSEAA
ncbi:TPA: cupin domain-containing protein [Neisseria gonorrhoeae]